MTASTLADRSATTRRPTRHAGALARRWPTALAVAATAASLAAASPLPSRFQIWLSAWSVLLAAVIYLTWGTARGDLAAPRWLTAQTVGVLAFGAVAVAAGAADPDAARYVLAAGWLGHAAWDVVHHHADRVVPRWYAELCMVCDVGIAASLLIVGTL